MLLSGRGSLQVEIAKQAVYAFILSAVSNTYNSAKEEEGNCAIYSNFILAQMKVKP